MKARALVLIGALILGAGALPARAATDFDDPTVALYGPGDPIELTPLKIVGIADDAVGVSDVKVLVTDQFGREYHPVTTCPECTDRFVEDTFVQFTATMPTLPGYYTVTATAYDAAEHSGSDTRSVIMI